MELHIGLLWPGCSNKQAAADRPKQPLHLTEAVSLGRDLWTVVSGITGRWVRLHLQVLPIVCFAPAVRTAKNLLGRDGTLVGACLLQGRQLQ